MDFSKGILSVSVRFISSIRGQSDSLPSFYDLLSLKISKIWEDSFLHWIPSFTVLSAITTNGEKEGIIGTAQVDFNSFYWSEDRTKQGDYYFDWDIPSFPTVTDYDMAGGLDSLINSDSIQTNSFRLKFLHFHFDSFPLFEIAKDFVFFN